MTWQTIDLHYAVVGFLVGGLVGVTGVGGGSLTTPILILLFGISPATAVGTDLLFAAATKTVGSFVHGFNRTINWRVVRRLAIGSIPATLLALVGLSSLKMSAGGAHQIITAVLALTLLLTAGTLIGHNQISSLYAERLSNLDERSIAILTGAMGAVLGVLVTFSSVGAGAIGVTALMLLYPRISAGAHRRLRYRACSSLDADRGAGSRSPGFGGYARARFTAGRIAPGDLSREHNFRTSSRPRPALRACRSSHHCRSTTGLRCRRFTKAGYFGRQFTLAMIRPAHTSGLAREGRAGRPS